MTDTLSAASDVPMPPPEVQLRHLVLGHGIQNYTCAASGNTTAATAIGALAALYDVSAFFPTSGDADLALPSVEAFNSLTSTVLWAHQLPLNIDASFPPMPGTSHASFAAVVANPFAADVDLTIPRVGTASLVGRHFFDAAGTPTFDIYAAEGEFAGDLFVGKKLANVKAPATADKGLLKTGAVDWLQLGDKGGSVGSTYVYRVVTAGGVSEPCTPGTASAGSVPYTAFYWLFG